MRVKICGITNLSDAHLACQLGAWALGFNFYTQSQRRLTPEKAKQIIASLPKEVLKIGIFIEVDSRFIEKTMHDVGLDLVQVYTEIAGLDKKLAILAIRPNDEQEIPAIEYLKQYAYILIDAPSKNNTHYGGTGKRADWKLASTLSQKVSLLLAGGLKPDNVKAARHQVNPFAVDVCSGIEQEHGIKSSELLTQFIKETHHA